jgi:energy-coupling factor transporter transmembrane protein EcfT
VFVCSFKTVDSLTRALEARGFGCTRKQTPFIMTKLRRSDCALIAASLVVAAAAIVLRAKGFGEVLSRL